MAFLSSSREYFSIPREQRELREAAQDATYEADSSRRAAWQRAMETLPYDEGGADILEKLAQREETAFAVDPSREHFTRLDQARRAVARAKDTAALSTDYEKYGTTDPAEVLKKQLSGGQYRTKEEVNRLLQYDPDTLARELRGQLPQEPAPAPEVLADTGAPGGTYSRIDTPANARRTHALMDLLGVAEHAASRREGGPGRRGAETQARYAADQFYTELAGREGVARAAEEVRARAAADPAFARIADRLLAGLNARGVSVADRTKFGHLVDRAAGRLSGQYLPADARTVSELARLYGGPGLVGPPAPEQPGLLDQLFGSGGSSLAGPSEEPTPSATPSATRLPSTGSPRPMPSPPPEMTDEEFLQMLGLTPPAYPPVTPQRPY